MRETSFIRQNKEKWQAFEAALQDGSTRDPDYFSESHIQIMNDLSFARTYFPGSRTEGYLNGLASVIYQRIYTIRRVDGNVFARFWKQEVPSLMYLHRKKIYIAFAVFFIFTLIGAFSARYDDQFVRLILGDGYVNMTLENIREGNPMGVYESEGMLEMSLMIILNNLKVSLYLFVLALLAGIGSIYMMMQNGVMLGSFQYFFYQHGVLGQSLRGIWIHGAMEIFSIVIVGGASLVMISGFLFPGTYSRMAAFKRSIRDGVRILLSTFPFIIAAGFFEGFVTRYSSSMPLWLNLMVILGSFSFIGWYYLIYPYIIHKKSIR